MLILSHSQNLNNKALVHKAFNNILRIMKDERTSFFLENNKEYVAVCLKRALNFEGRHTNSLTYLCSFILAHEDAFYPFS